MMTGVAKQGRALQGAPGPAYHVCPKPQPAQGGMSAAGQRTESRGDDAVVQRGRGRVAPLGGGGGLPAVRLQRLGMVNTFSTSTDSMQQHRHLTAL